MNEIEKLVSEFRQIEGLQKVVQATESNRLKIVLRIPLLDLQRSICYEIAEAINRLAEKITDQIDKDLIDKDLTWKDAPC